MNAQTDVIQCMLSLGLVLARCTALYIGFVMSLLKIPVEKKISKIFQWGKNPVKKFSEAMIAEEID